MRFRVVDLMPQGSKEVHQRKWEDEKEIFPTECTGDRTKNVPPKITAARSVPGSKGTSDQVTTENNGKDNVIIIKNSETMWAHGRVRFMVVSAWNKPGFKISS